MKRESKRNSRKVSNRVLKLEKLERREVFAVGAFEPAQPSLIDGFAAEQAEEVSQRSGTNANIANHRHQLSLR